jgi:sulfite exporter TauE/SafE
MLAALAAGALAGLLASPHCLTMCGPLAAFAAMPRAGAPRSFGRPLRWQLGRLAAYAGVGALAGASGAGVIRALAPEWLPTALAFALGAALIATALRLARAPSPRPVPLGKEPRTPLAARILARAPREPLVLGALTALLPCGALFAGALVAAGAGGAVEGAIAMSGFAVASGVPLLAAGALGAQPLGRAPLALRRLFAGALLLGALFTIARPLTAEPEGSVCHSE